MFESGGMRGRSLLKYRRDGAKCAKTPGDLFEARRPSWEWVGRGARPAGCGGLPTCARRVSRERQLCAAGRTPHPCTSRSFRQNATRRAHIRHPSQTEPDCSLARSPHHHQDVSAEAKPRLDLDRLKMCIPGRLAGEASRGGDFTAKIWRGERTWGGGGGRGGGDRDRDRGARSPRSRGPAPLCLSLSSSEQSCSAPCRIVLSIRDWRGSAEGRLSWGFHWLVPDRAPGVLIAGFSFAGVPRGPTQLSSQPA